MLTDELVFRIVDKDDVQDYVEEQYNRDYEAVAFKYNNLTVKSRIGKKTPEKTGYFTTLWTKNESDENRPLNEDEMSDFLMVGIQDGEHEGVFIFPKDVLVEKHYISSDNVTGKMGFRVYTPWNEDLNATAQKTFDWQKDYFVNFKDVMIDDH